MSNQPNPTASTPPLVFISYSRKDEKWRDSLRRCLEPAVKSGHISVWDDKEIISSARWRPEIDKAITQAKVAVLLISVDYLASKWITNEEIPKLLDLEQQRGLRIFPILLKPCHWEEISWLREIQLFPSDGKPIMGRSRNRQDELLNEAARHIVEIAAQEPTQKAYSDRATPPATPRAGVAQSPPAMRGGVLTMNDLADFNLSEEAKKVLNRAGILATYAKITPPKVTTSCLLFGMAEGGLDRSRFIKTPQFLWEQLTKDGGERYRNEFGLKFPNLQYAYGSAQIIYDDAKSDKAALVTHNVIEVFRHASGISARTFKQDRLTERGPGLSASLPGTVSARHLLAALLVFEPANDNTGALQRLRRMTDIAELRRNFFDFIVQSLPGDDHQAWRRILLSTEDEATEEEREGGVLEDETIEQKISEKGKIPAEPSDDKDFRAPLAGFLTDYWSGEDLLGITPDVNALASLVAAWSVEPPLSIGLFGDWGSGKTHFMRQMKARVEKLSRRARASNEPQNRIGYYKNIVQIEFNAWHYIEGNLWASLVEHIFEHLKLSDKEKITFAEERRKTLMDKLGVTKQIQAKAEERKEELKAKETQARERANEAKSKRDDTSKDLLRLRDELKSSVLNQLALPIEFSSEQEELLKQLGLSKSSLTSPAELHEQYKETKSLWGRVRAQWNIFRNDPMRLRKLLVPFALLFIPPLAGFLLFTLNLVATKFQAALASVVTFVLTFSAGAQPYWKKFKDGLSLLEEKNREIDNERQKRINELESEVNVLTRQYLDAEREAETISRQVKDLETKIADTSASKILAEFIEDRASASDYRRHLGVLAIIRRDFEKLAALFSQQREEERKGNGACDDKTINRIILYIDDLDRCPPERVVQVLQAIHLLLAFPLFVVIVGVDARWVTRSLQESYEWLRIEEGDEVKDEEAGEGQQVNRKSQAAAPHDYLEKIFQIPFWLKPMEDDACKNLLEGLTKESRDDSGAKQMAEADVETEGVRSPNTVKVDGAALAEATQRWLSPVKDLTQEAGALAGAQQQTGVETLAADGIVPVAETTSEAFKSDVGVLVSADTSSASAGGNGKPDGSGDNEGEADEDDREEIDLEPQSLKLSDKEIGYMKELTPLVGRSPRSVKRFLNCYRLIKVGMRPVQLKNFLGEGDGDGEYEAVMILLGVITGAPSISLYFIEELEKHLRTEMSGSLHSFLDALDNNPEINSQPDWPRVKGFLQNHVNPGIDSVRILNTLIAMTPRVSRYSFRVAKVERSQFKKAQKRGKRSQSSPEKA